MHAYVILYPVQAAAYEVRTGGGAPLAGGGKVLTTAWVWSLGGVYGKHARPCSAGPAAQAVQCR